MNCAINAVRSSGRATDNLNQKILCPVAGTGTGPYRFEWTEDRVQLLRRLIADRYSARQAASELGASITAVGKKARELGLSFHGWRSNEWPVARVNLLKQLWAEGLSGSAIALRLGDGVTRNAVLGQARKQGLPSRKTTTAPRSQTSKGVDGCTVHRVRAKAKRMFAFDKIADGLRDAFAMVKLPAELPAEAIPVEQRRTLLELDNQHCRWPYGDVDADGFFFCGGSADLTEGRPYCAYHSSIAFNGRPKPSTWHGGRTRG